MTLEQWGFQPCFAGGPLASSEIYARIIEEQRTSYRVITTEGELAAQLPGRLLHPSVGRLERPVVGDWVAIRPLWSENKAVIQRVLPRKGLLRRKAAGETEEVQPLAANVELAVIVTSLNKEFNEKRLQRYLTVVQESGSRAAVLLTKADLAPESREQAALLAAKYKVPCIALCALSGEGLSEAQALLLPGETAVFVGSSGVGKSTLVNALLGRLEQDVGGIREDDDRGRHTTTSRKLLLLESGALVIDTPGLREIQLEAGHAEGLSLGFAKIEELALLCKFGNCLHASEPGCAVKGALESGALSAEDHESYLKLKRETAFQERKTNRAAAAEEKKRWKSLAQSQRENYKHKGKK
jgi:ribosome biogenesis GTPase